MKIQIENSTMTCTLEAGEMPERHVLQAAVTKAIDENLWSVYLIIAPEVANIDIYKDLLLELGFLYSGNLSVNNKTVIKAKRRIRTSGETGDGVSTYGNTTLPPTATESAAVEEVRRRYSAPLSEEKLAALEAMGKQPSPEEKPDPVVAQMKAEIDAMGKGLAQDVLDAGTF